MSYNHISQRVPNGQFCLFTIILFIIYFLLSDICEAQWQPDMRLTNDPAESYTTFNNAWNIASYNNLVHVVWYDFRNNGPAIYYKQSSDEGVHWGVDTKLSSLDGSSETPSICVSGQVVHVTWEGVLNGNHEIFYKRSPDGGVNWEDTQQLTNDSAYSVSPCIASSSTVLHLVWEDTRDGNYEIYYKRSTNAGLNWYPDLRLTNDTSLSLGPSVAVSGQVVHVAWRDFRDGIWKIYYKQSTDNGTNWGTDRDITGDSSVGDLASIATEASFVHLTWDSKQDGHYKIFYKRSTNSGIDWETNTQLTYHPLGSWCPSISISGNNVHVVWIDSRDSYQPEIYYKRSTNGGVSWDSDTRLTYNPASSDYPTLTVSGHAVHVVWRDSRDGNFEIYYKRNPTGNPIGIKNINSEIPKKFELYQNYPNPFNPSTKIKFSVPLMKGVGGMNVKLIINDILGRNIATLVNERLAPGSYEVEWDASNFTSGIYFYKLTAGDYTAVRKLVLIK